MNRFFRTAYAAAFVYLFLALIAGLATGVGMPFPAFLCLYFGLLLALLPNALPKLRGREPLFLALGVLMALLGALPIRLSGGTAAHYVAHGLGVLAAGLFLRTLKHRTTHSDFAAKFRFSIVLVLALIALVYLSLLVRTADETLLPVQQAYVSGAIDHVVPVAIMLLVTGVLLLRGLRGLQGMVNEKAFNRRQLRDLLLYAAVVIVVFVFRPLRYLYRGGVWLMDSVVRPALRYLLWAFDQFLELIANKEPKFDPPTPEATPDPSEYVLPPSPPLFGEQEPEHYKIDEAGESRLYQTILYIFVGAFAAILLVILILEIRKMIRKLRERSAQGRGYPNEVRESLDEADGAHRGRKPRRRSGDPRLRMRYLYGEFLRFLRRVPLHIDPADTCGRIEQRAQNALRQRDEELAEFRALYEQARYRADEAPTEGDAARMKALLDRLKKGR